MANQKDVLVLTTSTVEGIKIKKHLKPVSAHLVAGTNLFSDFLGGMTDVLGGRSNSYQKQLAALYNEAIEKIKHSTHEIGGNCVLGLKIDLDEISGKGKSMFMLTAVGTAVIIDKDDKLTNNSTTSEKFENVGIERINSLRQRKEIIEGAKHDKLIYNDDTWDFISTNQVHEIFPYILLRFSNVILESYSLQESYNAFTKNFVNYIDALEVNVKVDLLYDTIEKEKNHEISMFLAKVIKELNLFNFEKNMILLQHTDFVKQKLGLLISTYDKPFYNRKDIESLNQVKLFIASNFKERGEITTKKQLLSSKEKNVWNCECGGKSNEIDSNCSSCNNDIYGFNIQTDSKPEYVIKHLETKIELINEFII